MINSICSQANSGFGVRLLALKAGSFERSILERIGKQTKTFRDPIFGDIFLNRLEVELVDTRDFQKLHTVRQLGSTYLVFSGALHTRFLHSLGVLHMTDFIIRSIEENQYPIRKLDDQYWKLVTRAAALLHDLPSIAFSHTLDDVGNLFLKQWKSRFRVSKLFGEHSETRKKVRDLIIQVPSEKEEESDVKLIDEYMDKKSVSPSLTILAKKLSDDIISDVIKINCPDWSDRELTSFLRDSLGKADGRLDNEKLKVSRDIVGNTICADLLDYTKRDFFFAGIDKSYDKRFLRSSVIDDLWNFAFRIYNARTGELKPSVVSQILDLLELRYGVAESVHFHHSKIMFSAMIIEAVNFTLQEKFKTNKDKLENAIWKFGDEGLLHYLEEDGVEASKRIIDRLFHRRKYDVAREYGEIRSEKREDSEPFTRYETITQKIREILRDPIKRYQIEHGVVNWLSHDETKKQVRNGGQIVDGDVLVYCPRKYDRLFKELEVRIIPKPKKNAVSLKELSMEHLQLGNVTSHLDVYLLNRISMKRRELIESYKNLWRARVFIFAECKPLHNEIMHLFDYIVSKFFARDVEESKYAPSFLPAQARKYLDELTSQASRLNRDEIPMMEDMLR